MSLNKADFNGFKKINEKFNKKNDQLKLTNSTKKTKTLKLFPGDKF